MKVYKCLKCGKEIKELPHTVPKEEEDTDKMWNDGIVFKMYAGYGSLLDGEWFTGALCDKCVDNMAQKKIIKYNGNYMDENLKKYIPLKKEKK